MCPVQCTLQVLPNMPFQFGRLRDQSPFGLKKQNLMVFKGNPQWRNPRWITSLKKGLKGNPTVFLTACPECIYEYLHMIREMGPLWIRCGKTDDEGIWVLWLIPTFHLCLCRKVINWIHRLYLIHRTEYQRWPDLCAGVWRVQIFPQGHISATYRLVPSLSMCEFCQDIMRDAETFPDLLLALFVVWSLILC